MTQLAKAEIRKKILDIRKTMDEETVKACGRLIVSGIMGLKSYIEAQAVYLYASVGNEADIGELIDISLRLGKKVLMPKVIDINKMEFYTIASREDLKPGYGGIPEPDGEKLPYNGTAEEKSFMAVPGVAFDRRCGRMGMGRGYYDKYIGSHYITKTCGVCNEFQLEEKVPMENHDKFLDYVVTEKNIYENGGSHYGIN